MDLHEINVRMLGGVGHNKVDLGALHSQRLGHVVARHAQTATVMRRQLPPEHQYVHNTYREQLIRTIRVSPFLISQVLPTIIRWRLWFYNHDFDYFLILLKMCGSWVVYSIFD